ncbi:unnamed protein product [Larinioides sclopetarius]|uniref:receptor protein-tyrosine kinase n=1 Tax=Larinioides sclopetarius TaxID=280406 RepID=A0AAV1ZDS6_9ARAC
MSLSWKFRDPKVTKKHEDIRTVIDTSESNGVFKSVIQLPLTSYEETGEYICYYNNLSASVYIFVNDESHLLLPLDFFLYTLHEGTRSVIPCLPTYSKANVTLWKIKPQSAEMIPLAHDVEYNPMEGFILKYPTTSFKGYFQCVAEFQLMSENFTFNIEILRRTLGQGAFGRVVKAEAFGLNDYEKSTTVAVKMLKERADINQQRALSAELKILIHLGHHVNIVNLMGAVTKNIEKGELLVMVEYCKYGNLRNYLLRHRDKFVNEMNFYNRSPLPLSESPPLDSAVTCFTEVRFDTFLSSSGSGSTVFAVDNPNYRQRVQSIISSDPKGSCSSQFVGRSMSCSSSNDSRYYCRVDSQEHVITTSDLLCFAFQSACGMDYLASRKLIHRDLAARNVLLAEEKVVKICDFGLAKDCYKYENYVKKGDGPLPIKWMAVESIRDHVFTTKSDVWSFGILMWEFFTLGSNPYPGIEIDEEFYKRLNAGFRMEKPDYCPEDVYHIMRDCWLANPDDRPDFSQIADTLGGLMEAGVKQHYMDLNAPYLEMNNKMLTHNYSNMPSDECQITPTRLYMNSDTSNSFLYDNLPPIHRPVLDASIQDDVLEDIPMIQLDIIEERQKGNDLKYEKNCTHTSDYLQMGESCSVR